MARLPLPLVPRWLRLMALVGVTSIIIYFSLVTTVQAPPGDSGIVDIWDKKLHFAAYAGFAFALAYATVEWQSRRLLRGGGVLGIALAFGFAIEVAQGVLPMRYYSHVNLLANLLGASPVVPWFVLEGRVRYVPLRRPENPE